MEKEEINHALDDMIGHIVSYLLSLFLTCSLIIGMAMVAIYLAKPVASLLK